MRLYYPQRYVGRRKRFQIDTEPRPPGFYDTPSGTGIYQISYRPPWPRKYGWVNRTRQAASAVPPTCDVLDLGCGMGVLAAMLHHEFRHAGTYLGWDFSGGALARAMAGNRAHGHPRAAFERHDIGTPAGRDEVREHVARHQPSLVGGKLVVTCCEVLEHMAEDRELVEAIPPGTEVVLTLPQYWAESHLRRFATEQDVRRRYGDLLDVRCRHFQFYPGKEKGHFLLCGVTK